MRLLERKPKKNEFTFNSPAGVKAWYIDSTTKRVIPILQAAYTRAIESGEISINIALAEKWKLFNDVYTQIKTIDLLSKSSATEGLLVYMAPPKVALEKLKCGFSIENIPYSQNSNGTVRVLQSEFKNAIEEEVISTATAYANKVKDLCYGIVIDLTTKFDAQVQKLNDEVKSAKGKYEAMKAEGEEFKKKIETFKSTTFPLVEKNMVSVAQLQESITRMTKQDFTIPEDYSSYLSRKNNNNNNNNASPVYKAPLNNNKPKEDTGKWKKDESTEKPKADTGKWKKDNTSPPNNVERPVCENCNGRHFGKCNKVPCPTCSKFHKGECRLKSI